MGLRASRALPTRWYKSSVLAKGYVVEHRQRELVHSTNRKTEIVRASYFVVDTCMYVCWVPSRVLSGDVVVVVRTHIGTVSPFFLLSVCSASRGSVVLVLQNCIQGPRVVVYR